MKKIIISIMLLGAASLVSCNKYLDETPDNRTELDNAEKYTSLLVSAYPTTTWITVAALSTDDYTDNGANFKNEFTLVEQAYRWEPISDNSTDSPTAFWESSYRAIASANHVIAAIRENGQEEECAAQLGEALICRAYNHFMLANYFCQAYNTETSDFDLGIPYVTEPEKTVIGHYTRGTVAEVYEKCDEDIEEGLPLITDAIYKQPKYHFNKKAAYAFAARFNLLYEQYDKAIEYATEALGPNPAGVLRDYAPLLALSQGEDVGNLYINKDLECNLMLLPVNSTLDRMTTGHPMNRRFCHNRPKAQNETLQSSGPWGSTTDTKGLNVFARSWRYTSSGVMLCKLNEYFEYTDQAAGIGYPHVVNVAFTTEEALLIRAEAEVMTGDYAGALDDLNIWYKARGYKGRVNEEGITNFYRRDMEGKYPNVLTLNPKGFAIDEMQWSYILAVLHAKRIEFNQEGLRWLDIKRWGIEVKHELGTDGDSDVLTVDDLRRAFQLPSEVISSGMEPNPR